jgi:hypothetical protein
MDPVSYYCYAYVASPIRSCHRRLLSFGLSGQGLLGEGILLAEDYLALGMMNVAPDHALVY